MGGLGNALHIVDEPHVEHTVSFIEHKPARLRKIDKAVAHQIGQASWRCNQNIDARSDTLDLRQLGDAAQNERRRDVRLFGYVADRLLDLHRQFTRRREDQRTRGFRAALVAKSDDLLENGKAESRRLAEPVWAMPRMSRPSS